MNKQTIDGLAVTSFFLKEIQARQDKAKQSSDAAREAFEKCVDQCVHVLLRKERIKPGKRWVYVPHSAYGSSPMSGYGPTELTPVFKTEVGGLVVRFTLPVSQLPETWRDALKAAYGEYVEAYEEHRKYTFVLRRGHPRYDSATPFVKFCRSVLAKNEFGDEAKLTEALDMYVRVEEASH